MKTSNEFPITNAAEQAIDRREFLRLAAGAATVAAAGEWLGRSFFEPAPAGVAPMRIADGVSLAPGEARVIMLVGTNRSALLVRLGSDRLVAFDRHCPHLGCPVLWSASRRLFECPCHNAVFDAETGAVLHGPPRRGLDPFTVEVRGNDVWVRGT